MSSTDHIAPPHRYRLDWDNSERIRWIREDHWFAFPKAIAVMKCFHDLLAYPPRGRMPCLLLYGRTGMGKSHIVGHFARLHEPSFDDVSGLTTRPVVAFQIPPEPTEAEFYEEMLRKIECYGHLPTSTRALRALARSQLTAQRVRMLILDEVNYMLACTYREQRLFLNTLRFLANDLRIPIVCTGNEDAQIALKTDDKLAERFKEYQLRPWKSDRELTNLMIVFESTLPLRQASRLAEGEVCKRVIEITEGNTGRIFRVIETLAAIAIETGREFIDLASFDIDEDDLPLVSMKVKSSPTAGRGPVARMAA
jgi:Bacterial TniB protein